MDAFFSFHFHFSSFQRLTCFPFKVVGLDILYVSTFNESLMEILKIKYFGFVFIKQNQNKIKQILSNFKQNSKIILIKFDLLYFIKKIV